LSHPFLNAFGQFLALNVLGRPEVWSETIARQVRPAKLLGQRVSHTFNPELPACTIPGIVSRFNHFNLAFKIAAINPDPVLSLAFAASRVSWTAPTSAALSFARIASPFHCKAFVYPKWT
jgi:hypothetical protein